MVTTFEEKVPDTVQAVDVDVTNRSGMTVFFPSQHFIFTVQDPWSAGSKKILTYYLRYKEKSLLSLPHDYDRPNLF